MYKWQIINHISTSGRENVFDKDEYGFLSTELNSFPDDINKLPNCQVSRYQISAVTCIQKFSGMGLEENINF